jgi:G3E family GTPase
MLQNIPTHVIAGPLGAGKTSLIKHLLAQRPAGERWAVLINEFGQIGLDAALLTQDADGIALGEVAGGCLCCVNGAPFQIGSACCAGATGSVVHRAVRAGASGAVAQAVERGAVGRRVGGAALCDGARCPGSASGKALPESQQDALGSAGLLLLNKAEGLDASDRQRIAAQLPARSLY